MGLIAGALAMQMSLAGAEEGAPTRGFALVVVAVDADGERVDPSTSHASISRVLPAELSPDRVDEDHDALSWVVATEKGKLPLALSLRSTRPNGKRLDDLDDVVLTPGVCPEGIAEKLVCARTPPIRACADRIDAGHPAIRERSLVAEVGGHIRVRVGDKEVVSIPVGGPRHSALGNIGRFRARLRVRLVRPSPGGGVPVGGDEVGAVTQAKREITTASRIWGQCGIHFGFGDELDVAVVDPPPPHLLAIGCEVGLPSSGGEIAFRVDGKAVRIVVPPEQTPTQVAGLVAAELSRDGLVATVSVNAQAELGALRTADVLVRRSDGTLVTLSADGKVPLSSDPTLSVCVGEVNLQDGLTHFSDFNAPAGTVEERSLIKAFDDGDPTTVDVLIIPSFAAGGRIGESFIFTEGGAIANTIIMDRAGIRSGEHSFALAHELGHILLELPGHPDDYGIDQPTRLMDADAADATIFGPRQLSVHECERAIRQTGPDGPIPILQSWPLER